MTSFRLNGHPAPIEGLDPNTTLLQHARGLGLTATKEGCAEGDCGACTVAVLEPGREEGVRYRAVNSCLVLLPALAGLEVWTAEGLSAAPGEGALHPVQREMAADGGSQCGYCTPGFVMSLFCDRYAPPEAHRPPLTDVLAGNLCRCTGYRPILEAGERLRREPPAPDDPFAARTAAEAPPPARAPVALQRDGRRFHRPDRLEAAISLLASDPRARAIAGGTDLVLEVTRAFRPLESLVALDGIAALREVRRDAGGWEIGATATLSEVAEALRGGVPLLDQMLPLFASLQIRNRATVGGNLATASPIGDLSPVLLALDATLRLCGPQGEREVPLSRFFTGYRQTVLRRGEVLVAVRLPHAPPRGRRIERAYKVAKRNRMDISTVAAAFRLDLDGAGRIVEARVAYGGVAPTPARAPLAEAALIGRPWDGEALGAARLALEGQFNPITDLRGSATYRRALIGNLLTRLHGETAGMRGYRA